METKLNIISGTNGQDGSYLAEILLNKGERVVGFSRRTATGSNKNIEHLMDNPNFTYLQGDLTDQQFIWKLIADYKPDKFYNLGAQSHVHVSFTNPGSTFEINTIGVLNVLEAIRTLSPDTRLYQASTSELFGSSANILQENDYNGEDRIDIDVCQYKGSYKPFQDEYTYFSPNSPYSVAKLASHHLVGLYRKSYGLWACSGILFNHESRRRPDSFVTSKIVNWVADFKKWMDKYKVSSTKWLIPSGDEIYIAGRTNIEQGFQINKLRLGLLDISRDWGHSYDYMMAAILMMEQSEPNDFVVGTGETHTVREFLDEAFSLIGVEDWSDLVVIDSKFIRPSEVPYLRAKPDKIKAIGWKPTYTFTTLVKDMMDGALNERL